MSDFAPTTCALVLDDPTADLRGATGNSLPVWTILLSLLGMVSSSAVLLTVMFVYPRAASEHKGCQDNSCVRCSTGCCNGCRCDEPVAADEPMGKGGATAGRSILYLWMVYVLGWVNLLGQGVVFIGGVVGYLERMDMRYALVGEFLGDSPSAGDLVCTGSGRVEAMTECMGYAAANYAMSLMSFTWSVLIGVIAVLFLCRGPVCRACRRIPEQAVQTWTRLFGGRGRAGSGARFGAEAAYRMVPPGSAGDSRGEEQKRFVDSVLFIALSFCALSSLASVYFLLGRSFDITYEASTSPPDTSRSVVSLGGICGVSRSPAEQRISLSIGGNISVFSIACFVAVGAAAASAASGPSTGCREWTSLFYTALLGEEGIAWIDAVACNFCTRCCLSSGETEPHVGRAATKSKFRADGASASAAAPSESKQGGKTGGAGVVSPLAAAREASFELGAAAERSTAASADENKSMQAQRVEALRGITPLRFYPLIIVMFVLCDTIVTETLIGVTNQHALLSNWPLTVSLEPVGWTRPGSTLRKDYGVRPGSFFHPYPRHGQVAAGSGDWTNGTIPHTGVPGWPVPTLALDMWRGCVSNLTYVGVSSAFPLSLGHEPHKAHARAVCVSCGSSAATQNTLASWNSSVAADYLYVQEMVCGDDASGGRRVNPAASRILYGKDYVTVDRLASAALDPFSERQPNDTSLLHVWKGSLGELDGGDEAGRRRRMQEDEWAPGVTLAGERLQFALLLSEVTVQTVAVLANAAVFLACTPVLWQFSARFGRGLREDAEAAESQRILRQLAKRKEEEEQRRGGEQAGVRVRASPLGVARDGRWGAADEGGRGGSGRGLGVGGSPLRKARGSPGDGPGMGRQPVLAATFELPSAGTAGRGGASPFLDPPQPPPCWSVVRWWGHCFVGHVLVPIFFMCGKISSEDLGGGGYRPPFVCGLGICCPCCEASAQDSCMCGCTYDPRVCCCIRCQCGPPRVLVRGPDQPDSDRRVSMVPLPLRPAWRSVSDSEQAPLHTSTSSRPPSDVRIALDDVAAAGLSPPAAPEDITEEF